MNRFSSPALGRPAVFSLASLTMAALLSAACVPAYADIISDGGFEAAGAGNIYSAGQSIDSSWTVGAGAVYIDSLDPYVYDGNNSLNLTLADLFVPDSITQTLSTVAGQRYALSFYADADAANAFSILLNGALLAGSPSSIAQNGFPSATSNSSQFVRYTDGFTATSNSTTLTFAATANPAIGSPTGSVMLDDVSATAVTPEPSSIALVLTGLAGVGEMVRRKRFTR